MANKSNSKKKLRIFISYTRRSETDCKIADFVYDFLKKRGHEPFIDVTMRVGTEWLNEIDKQIRTSDFIIVLLSNDSANSEMVQAEIRRAYEYRRRQGNPKSLPIRVNYEDILPYSFDAFLEQLQHIFWYNENDNYRIAMELLDVIEGTSITQNLMTRAYPKVTYVSEDGHPTRDSKQTSAPLPEFDPRFLEDLEVPGGTIKINDKFYIERESDKKFKREISKLGTTTTIRAARQTGKSSLLARGINSVLTKTKVVHIDLQKVDKETLFSQEKFTLYLANIIARKLLIHRSSLDQIWKNALGSQDKLTMFLDELVLGSRDNKQIILAIDEADRLLETPFHSDFFALLRSWHNSRAIDKNWQKLNIAMVISTEPYLLIADPNQSPFNVGLKIDLQDFTEDQVAELNQKHRGPIADKELGAFFMLLNGHPYLTRKGLYALAVENLTWNELRQHACAPQSPFSDHLRRQHWLLHDELDLKNALKQIILSNRSEDENALHRLMKAGLIVGSGNIYKCRCELYYQYFKDKLQ